MATSHSSNPHFVSLTSNARIRSQVADAQIGDHCLDDEGAARLEVSYGVAEAGPLRFLIRQVHDRVEDEVCNRERTLNAIALWIAPTVARGVLGHLCESVGRR